MSQRCHNWRSVLCIESFCQNIEVISWYLYFTLLAKKCRFGESFVIGNLVLRIYFTIIYGERITQFIYVTLLCWTANNVMVLFFKVYVGQWLTQVIFYSVLDSKYRLFSFKTRIFQLNICFLFCDGVCSTSINVLLMFLFNSFCLGNINKISI